MSERRQIFINLPVVDLARATAFHEGMGARREPRFSNELAAMMVVSEGIHVMLLTKPFFSQFTTKTIIDPKTQVQVLVALSTTSRAEVDGMVERAVALGGVADPGPRQDHGFMYGRSFEDPDGHVFEIVWMDSAQTGVASNEQGAQ